MLIIDRAMPRTCSECFCYDIEYSLCQASEHNNLTSEDMVHKPCWCPLTEIVQCKDCEHWDMIAGGNGVIKAIGTCDRRPGQMSMGDGYCKWANRRTE